MVTMLLSGENYYIIEKQYLPIPRFFIKNYNL